MSEKNIHIFTNILATLSLLSVALMWRYNFILFFALLSLALFMLSLKKSKAELKTFLYCSFSGAIAECLAISFGAWTYQNPDIFYIPIWLPLLWGIASLFIVRSKDYFSR